MKIGIFLFGWWDKRFNIRKGKFDWGSFYADRYSAFYRFMRPGSVIRNLREAGFEVVEITPPMRAYDFLYQRAGNKKAQALIRLLRHVPLSELVLTAMLRVRQFFFPGDVRGFVCVKVTRPNVKLHM